MTKIRILTVLLIMPLVIVGQNDKKNIEATVLGYIENFYANDYNKMEKFLHDEITKRGLNQNGKINKNLSKKELKKLLYTKKVLSKRYQKNLVSNIFIDREFATAVLITGYPNVKWKEYIHLVKLNGKWLIMDVFWNFEE